MEDNGLAGFARTECACDEDREHCRRQPGCLAPGDLQRIARHLGSDAAGKFVPSSGALVKDTRTGQVFRIPTITPARKPDGSCVFFDAQERCAIHEIAPAGCAYFDAHMGKAEAGERSLRMHRAIAQSPTYTMQRESLRQATEER